MVVVPAATPVTIPVLEPMVATDDVLLLHAPNAVASFSVVDEPTQTLFVPPIVAGNGLTVSTIVLIQPVGNV